MPLLTYFIAGITSSRHWQVLEIPLYHAHVKKS